MRSMELDPKDQRWEKLVTEIEKARPLGRAGLGAVVSNAPLGGHPDTCDLAATRRAVVAMHMVENPGAHDCTNASRARGRSQPIGRIGKDGWTSRVGKRLHFGVVVNNFTYCVFAQRSACQPFIAFGSGGLK